jgi:hypothetical protein
MRLADGSRNRILWVIFSTTALIILAALLRYVWHRISTSGRTGDFDHFYYAALAMRTGANPYEVIAPGYPQPGYLYPPLLAFLYVPFTYLSDFITAAHASLVVDVLTLTAAMAIGAQAMLERFGEKATAWNTWKWPCVIALGLLLSLDKTKGELQMLQTNVFILASLMIALWSLDRSAIGVGAAIGFAINIKYQALIVLPYLLIRRRWGAAGWTVLWMLFFSLLPSVMIGFGTEVRYLAMAFAGVLNLVGIHPIVSSGGIAAQIEGIDSLFSVSVTSAIARWLKSIGSSISPMAVSAMVGVVWMAILAAIYRGKGVPWLRWPAVKKGAGQAVAPWNRRVAVEWMILIAIVLCFSPQTNSRHLMLTMGINFGALALILTSRFTVRALWPLVAGVAIIWAGLNLPSGHWTPTMVTHRVAGKLVTELRDVESPAVVYWRKVGGPSWAILVGMLLMVEGAYREKRVAIP